MPCYVTDSFSGLGTSDAIGPNFKQIGPTGPQEPQSKSHFLPLPIFMLCKHMLIFEIYILKDLESLSNNIILCD